MNASPGPHLRSFLCAPGHELRVTLRCTVEDLRDSPNAEFAELAHRHQIVNAFCRERAQVTVGRDSLRPQSTDRPLTILRHSNDWRGVTWFEEESGVVWLCASARHRSGQSGDAYPTFVTLRNRGKVWPIDSDYESLMVDRGTRFSALVTVDAPKILEAARTQPNIEYAAQIGLVTVNMVFHVVDTVESIHVAFPGIMLDPEQFILLFVSILPGISLSDWNWENRLPTRELDRRRSEICFSYTYP